MIIDLRILLLTITYTEDVVVEKEYTKPYFATMSPTLLRHHQHRFFFLGGDFQHHEDYCCLEVREACGKRQAI